MHDGVDVARAHPLGPARELPGDLVGRADGDEERLADKIEIEAAVHLVGARGADLELVDREIAGRRQILRRGAHVVLKERLQVWQVFGPRAFLALRDVDEGEDRQLLGPNGVTEILGALAQIVVEDRKSTRLNSSHLGISYAVFCLKKK